MRRHHLVALATLAALALLPVAAQDARPAEARQAARAWLALVDRSEGGEAWTRAGDKFRRTLSESRWQGALRDAREPLGANTGRRLLSTRFMEGIDGMPRGEYAQLQFRSSFAQREEVGERLTLERTARGWQVIGYFIA